MKINGGVKNHNDFLHPHLSGIRKKLWNEQTEQTMHVYVHCLGTRRRTMVRREAKFVRNKRQIIREKYLKKIFLILYDNFMIYDSFIKI